MAGYTKLFSEIVGSTVWREPNHIRILWITMLALKDRWHKVNVSIPGLADFAKISIQECEAALEVLSSPDPYSRTKEFEGRRIEACDEGWIILNGEKYRNKLSLDERREYQRVKQKEYRERKKAKEKQQDKGALKSCLQSGQQITHTDTDTDTKAEAIKESPPFEDPVFKHWQKIMGHPRSKLDAKRKKILKAARIMGYSDEDLKTAIDGCYVTPWNMGENPDGTVYDSLELILRDAEHIDRFIRNQNSPPKPRTNADRRTQSNIAAAMAAGEKIND